MKQTLMVALLLFASVLAWLPAYLSGFHSYRISTPAAMDLTIAKMLAEALAAYLGLLAAIAAVLAVVAGGWFWRSGSPGRTTGLLVGLALATLVLGVLGAARSMGYVRRVSAGHAGFERAFGKEWTKRISASRLERLPAQRWSWRLPADVFARDAVWERDVAFATLPENGRKLLADVWQPPDGAQRSGLAVIYFHGGGFAVGDKDMGTQALFQHLVAQGHLVMDVAYRLCPETDIYGMAGDARRAVAWMKANAGAYQVDPRRIVVFGESAGGALALLTAYAPDVAELTPDDLRGQDLSVAAAVSFYGAVDLADFYEHIGGPLGLEGAAEEIAVNPIWRFVNQQVFNFASRSSTKFNSKTELPYMQMMEKLMGGSPAEAPETYALASPITYAGPGSPPTLLVHGGHDSFAPVESARALYRKLALHGAPVVYNELPQTEHAFDVGSVSVGPAAQTALYDLDRFLALVVEENICSKIH